MDPVTDSDPDGRAVRLRVAIAAILALAAVLTIVVMGLRAKTALDTPAGPLAVAAADQPGAGTAACGALMAALPDQLGGTDRRSLAGSPTGVAAYGDPATVIRCGLSNPAELTCSAGLTDVDQVSWLQLSDVGAGGTTYLAVDRSVRIAITVPDGSGTGALQQLSDIINATLPRRAVCANGTLLPTDG